jgi:hypothetical protein
MAPMVMFTLPQALTPHQLVGPSSRQVKSDSQMLVNNLQHGLVMLILLMVTLILLVVQHQVLAELLLPMLLHKPQHGLDRQPKYNQHLPQVQLLVSSTMTPMMVELTSTQVRPGLTPIQLVAEAVLH